MNPSPLDRVTELGEERRAARERVRVVTAELRAAIIAARQAGALPEHLIRASGLARQTVYDVLASGGSTS